MEAEKIVVGPEHLILDKDTYPITFGTLCSIQEYTNKVKEINKQFQDSVCKAEARKSAALQKALYSLKGSLS